MGAYRYLALKKTGVQCKGTLEADSERHARQLLREQGLIPTEVAPLKNQLQSRHKDKLSTPALCLLTRQLATLLLAGIPVEEALQGVSDQTEKDSVRRLIIGVRANVMQGYSLAQAMNEYPQAFPELYRATVAAGEQTGHLDVVLEKLALHTEKQEENRHKVQHALIYPVLMLIVSVSIISFLLVFVVPKMLDVFTSQNQTLPSMTLVLIGFSQFLKHYGLYLALSIAIMMGIFKRSLANAKVRKVWDGFLLKIPIVSYLLKTSNVARYIHTFSILFAAGVNVLDAMRVSASLINNVVMKSAFEFAAIRVKEGTPINQALNETKFIRPMALHLIGSGEKSGQLAVMMERAASYLDNEVNRLIDTSLSLLEPVIILLMGGVVLFIVLATLVPIFSMEQLV